MEKGFGNIKIMCIATCGLTKDYGVIASDSAEWNPTTKSMTFDKPKLMIVGGKHLMTFIGSTLFLTKIEKDKFNLPFDCLSVYLSEYLREINSSVQETSLGLSGEPARLCLFLLGIHGGKPTLAQFNSFLNFKPEFLWCDDGIKFSTIYYGDDSNKNEIFKKSTEFMEKESNKYKENINHGLVGEILTRGIYHKADLEEQIGDKVKYAGGVVSVARIHSDGQVYAPSNLINI